LRALDDSDCDVIYLDYAKAFDKVDHDLLLKKLSAYGVSGKTLWWIKNFLSGRKQKVVINGHESFWVTVISGVIQGSVLGPILFIIFINDLQHYVKSSTLRCFADDTRLTKRINNSQEDTCLMQNDLNHVITWSKSNNMELNESKFELISFSKHISRTDISELPYASEFSCSYTTSQFNELTPVSSLRDLGIIISDNFTWSEHITKITSKANQMAAWAMSLFKHRGKSHMLVMYKSFVRSHLEFCCPLWNPYHIQDIIQLEKVQRTFTSKIHGYQHFDYWERLSRLNLLSLQRRRERYILVYMWKILQGNVPNDVGMIFNFNPRRGFTAVVKPIVNSQSRAQTVYDNSFIIVGAKLWNILPFQINTITSSLNAFKTGLSNFLKIFPDKPPVNGYVRANSNSLLDWWQTLSNNPVFIQDINSI